ncbi:MAG TPA: hypothetical protein VLK66_19750 [Longimicrobium sp.]|nr:hypothetical protein [Longimicrobium sp.]
MDRNGEDNDSTGARPNGKSIGGRERPHLTGPGFSAAYAEMAADAREAEASEWCEALLGDVADESACH